MTERGNAEFIDAVAALLGAPAVLASGSGSGANSKVVAVESAGKTYAAKRYPDWRMSGSVRCRAEWRALSLLRDGGVRAAPVPIAHDPENALLLLEWIDGAAIVAPTDADVEQALVFLADVFALSERAAAADFPLASEACLSGADIAAQIDARLGGFAPNDELERFLAGPFSATYARAKKRAQNLALYSGVLPPSCRRLIPADFGFHNALRQADGRIRFFDFDYFGWDDPVKLAADFVLHPAGRLSQPQSDRVVAHLASLCDPGFAARAAAYFPLFALRWALIVLNLFRLDRQAGAAVSAEMQARQLEKASRLVTLSTDMVSSAS